jgi:hypothetical protein
MKSPRFLPQMIAGRRLSMLAVALLATVVPAPARGQSCGTCVEQCEIQRRDCRAVAKARAAAGRTYCVAQGRNTLRFCGTRFRTIRRACATLCEAAGDRASCLDEARAERDDCRNGLAAEIARCGPDAKVQRSIELATCDGDRDACAAGCPP